MSDPGEPEGKGPGGQGRGEADKPALSAEEIEAIQEGFRQGAADLVSPEDHETLFELGVAYSEMGLIDDAIESFEASLRAAPGFRVARRALEEARRLRGPGGPPRSPPPGLA